MADGDAETAPTPERIIPQMIEDEMKRSYLDYAMSVIVGRALPDVRDGLKPVHRRILYAMNDMGMRNTSAHKKSARIVGEVLGKYHPHGDSAVYDTLVRMAQDFSLRYTLIDGQGNWGCFTKDTKVTLADGRKLSFEELVAEHKRGRVNYTYTIDKDGGVRIARIEAPRLTKRNAQIMSVVLDNGETIRCTLNHRFMLRNGEYKEAKKLKEGDSLMPLYTKLSGEADGFAKDQRGYLLVHDPVSRNWVAAHHLADLHNLCERVYARSAGRVRHHKDFNKLNNNPDNIVRMQWGDHLNLHSRLAKHRHATDPEYVKRLANGRRAFWSNPKNRQANSRRLAERNRKNWKDPVYADRMRKTLSESNKRFIQHNPSVRRKFSRRFSATLRRLWQDPAYRAAMRQNIIKGNKNHKTNLTGKRKFLRICKQVLENEGTLNGPLYELHRNKAYPYGRATSWERGMAYYENDDLLTRVDNAYENHKILRVENSGEHEDVYDLTVSGTHNFALAAGVFVHNSVDGDNAAAMRYTEARLTKIADELLQDIDKETVKFSDNFDATLKEPAVLPAKLPNLLINGSTGIAVGMATNIPPHNLREVCAATVALIDNPDIEPGELLEHVKGPDFPTRAIIAGRSGILQAYSTGRGSVRIRSVINIEPNGDRKRLVVTEIPYMVNKAQLVEQIADAVREKRVEGISDLRDESDRKGMRIVIELKRDANPEIVENHLLLHTRLQVSFGIIMLALVDGRPKVLPLKELLEQHVLHRRQVVRARTEFELRKAEQRAHILEGMVVCIDHIDPVVALIKKAANADAARAGLIETYNLTEIQANAILDMKLQRLTGLEREKIKQELESLLRTIEELKSILADENRILSIIKEELQDLSTRFGDQRRTEIVDAEDEEIDMEDLIDRQDQAVTISNAGYAKRMPLDLYRAQRRGGMGVKGATTREDDFVEHLFVANTHDYLLLFTDKGKVYWKKVYYLPEASRQSKGKALINLINLEPDERINAVIPISEFSGNEYLFFATRRGVVKKTALPEYGNIRKGGIRAITLTEGDELVTVLKTDGKSQILLASRKGQAVKFVESDVRVMGRTATGVRGIRLKADDAVVGAVKAPDASSLLTVTANGFGKRSPVADYRLIGRGGQGVRNIIRSERNGDVVAIKCVDGNEEIMLSTKNGTMIRTPLEHIRVIGRNTQGVKVMNLREGDRVIACAKIVREEGDQIEETE